MSGTATNDPLVKIDHVTVHFEVRQGWRFRRAVVHALDDVSISMRPGRTLGLVGESGSGKTTLGRTILRRIEPEEGTIWFDGTDLTGLHGEELRRFRVRMQSVFQDPYGSLNPRRKIVTAVAEPLVAHALVARPEDAEDRVAELLELVGLPPEAMHRYPSAFSGGQLQRISIARALAVDPEFIVADEPVSSLDVSIQAQVANLLQDLQEKTGVAYLFISHDIAVVRHIAHEIAVMYAGKIVETGPCDEVLAHPVHPYTQALIDAVPSIDPNGRDTTGRVLEGEPADPIDPPSGCRFRTRCPIAEPGCAEAEPPLEDKAPGHAAACWLR